MAAAVDSASTRFFSDSASALGRQFAVIFLNLRNASHNRRRRVDECLSALLDLLVAHAKEIGEHEGLVVFLFQNVQEAFDSSLDRGIDALRVVFDVHIGDRHEERCRCFNILMKQIANSTDEKGCALLLSELSEVLQENMRSASDLLGKHLNSAVAMMKEGELVRERAIGCQILATMVEKSSTVIKTNPALLEILTNSCQLCNLLCEIIDSMDEWHRKALVRLFTIIVEKHCIEVTSTLGMHLSSTLADYMGGTRGEEQHIIIGILTAIEAVTNSSTLRTEPWPPKLIWSFLIERKWQGASVEVRVMVTRATASALFLFTKEERMFDEVIRSLLSYISDYDDEKVALSALSALDGIRKDVNLTMHVTIAVNAILGFIVKYPFHQEAFDTLEHLRSQYGETCVSDIYNLSESLMDNMACTNIQKVSSLLHFMGDNAPLTNEKFKLLQISIRPDDSVDALVRAIFFLSSLGRTSQLCEVVELMFHESLDVRKAAVDATVCLCEILIRRAELEENSHHHRLDNTVTGAVGKLLDVAVADRDTALRNRVLNQLSPLFNPYLSLPDHLDALFMAWNDVSRRARENTLALLCRLHPCHPGIVHPQLLRMQQYMLREIEAKDGSMATAIYQASLLRMTAECNTLLLQPKMVELAVLERLEKQPFVSMQFSIALLNLLKAVLDHTGSGNHCDAKRLLQPVIHIVNGSHSSKRRETALETLCSILTSTITVSEHSIYVDVYRALARIIRTEAEEDERVNYAAMKALSVIGATNPVKIRYIVKALEDDEIEKEEEVVTPALAHYKPRMRLHPQMKERYPSIVLYLLVKTLQQSADAQQQTDTMATINSLIREVPGNQKSMLLTQFLPQLQSWLVEPEKAHLYEGILLLMTELATLLRQYRDIILPTTGSELLKSVRLFCALPQASQKPLNAFVVELLDEVARGLSAQEMRDHRWAVEFIHQRLSQDKDDLALILRAVKSLESFLAVLHEKDLQTVLPHVLQCIEPADAIHPTLVPKVKEINTACFDFLNQIMLEQPSLVKDCCAEVVHTIMWYIERSVSREEMEMGLRTLAFLIEVVKRPAKRFIQPIERLSEQKGFSKMNFAGLLNSAAQGFLKVPIQLIKQDSLNPELPLSVVSRLPALSKRDFEEEMMTTMRLTGDDFKVTNVEHQSGQTIIRFFFHQGENRVLNFRSFTRKAQETQSTLRRNLGIFKLVQKQTKTTEVDEVLLQKITTIPVANKKKREQSWITWLHNTSTIMLKNSPIEPLRCTSTLAGMNIELSRELFPFAASAFIAELTKPQQSLIMDAFSRAVRVSPNDIKQALFGFAEFLESERGNKVSVVVKRIENFKYIVERESQEQKFGIIYDEERSGIVVKKLEPNGPGALAGVPVGAFLISINNKNVRSVNEIPSIIKGLNRIELLLSRVVKERHKPEQKPLMDLDVLARVAFESQMHAKSIFLNEVLLEELFSEIRGEVSLGGRQDAAVRRTLRVVERLIEFYGHLGLTMVAKGLVQKMSEKFSGNIIAPEQFGFDEVGTLEQLNWWGEALSRYQSRMINAEGAVDKSSLLGSLRCYNAQGEFTTMQGLINDHWNQLDEDAKLEVAPFKAQAALSLGEWKKFDEFAEQPAVMERLGMIERCAALFRQSKHDELIQYTEDYRRSLFDSFSESFVESYNRSYDILLELQHLRHFEELVSYVQSDEERRSMLRSLWQKRLSNMSSRPASIRELITINSLVLEPSQDLASQVMCIRVLTKSHWTSVADHLLNQLLGPNRECASLCRQDPDLIHVYMKHCFATKSKREAFRMLSEILRDVCVSPRDVCAEAWGCCWRLLGEWTMHLFPEKGDEAIEELKKATELGPTNHAAFHSLGILHYDLSRDPNTSQEIQTRHHIDSLIALFKSVQFSPTQSNAVMEDVLRVLSIWFSHSTVRGVNEAIREGVESVPDYVWLNVIPQLVARIGITAKLARSILTDLLIRVGSKYPHALIYPLTVTEKSPEAIRRLMAERVLKGIRVSNGPMVDEASLISNEMVRIAILWAEKWHSQIQRAAAKQGDAVAILRILEPLYKQLEHPNSPNEHTFEKTYGATLRRARNALQNNMLDQAWSLLKQMYVQLNKSSNERRLHMLDVSPTLGSISKSIVAVPGTFVLGQPLITIQKFHSRVYVMPSKQKPRRFGIDASDGRKYRFLLKGHEDLRQDERVMQFVALINTIFTSDGAASAIGLTIPQYAVIPLTDNVGILGWVENTETIYKMLETHRKERQVSIYEEVDMIVKFHGLKNIEEYHQLPKQQRKSALSHVITNSTDDELRRIVWDKNDTCEQWLQYRSTYGHTLAIMSIVGYVLGLGDRHLNNLMLQDKGSVVHIDFGDCFEVTMHRQFYAEAVPFRLTRLLVSALGITGVDGVYRLTCELVTKNLRRHCENLLSILEAFIYDPLINWRLTSAGEGERSSSRTERMSPSIPQSFNFVDEKSDEQQTQLSFSVLKFRDTAPASTLDQLNEEETRNQQGDLALARVRAKLTGEDFGVANSSFNMQNSRREPGENSGDASSWESQSFGNSPKDSFGGPVLTTYLSLRAVNGGSNCLDVPHQVDRLIMEATSLDNLAEAYITGWAPFW